MSRLLCIVLQCTLEYMYLFKSCLSLDRCPGVGLLDQIVVLFLVFWGISILLSIVVAQCTIPPTVYWCSFFSTPSLAIIVCRLLDDGHSGWYKVVPHSGFDLHFPNLSDVEHLSMCFWPFVYLIWRTVCLHLLPEIPSWHSRNESNWEPWGCRFDPWPRSVG